MKRMYINGGVPLAMFRSEDTGYIWILMINQMEHHNFGITILFTYFVSDISSFFRLKCEGRRTASIAAGARLLGRLVGRSIVEDGVNNLQLAPIYQV